MIFVHVGIRLSIPKFMYLLEASHIKRINSYGHPSETKGIVVTSVL